MPGLEDRPIRRTRAASGALNLLLAYAELLRQQGPTRDAALAEEVADHLTDLVALALRPTGDAPLPASNGGVRAARLAAIRADVLANLGQIGLSARTIARRHGVTDRYVHMLFEETGQTFGRFVEEERLKRALALLTDPERARQRIGDIACAVGFAEHSSFDRAFRRRFGDTPGGMRRRRAGV
jgi:transcriptional regulator GlxA family with amidase domain